ncbi:hypothetical protein [Thermovenabulum sp.]|uniref:hypothetical protein n=1 Tax=Thermovenabulum sp. TaxID=3100335 RepID=UPI003C7E8C1D
MSMPVIPERDFEESVIDILESIALEEAALAHILNAEGEKIQKVTEKVSNPGDLIKLQKSVKEILQMIIKKEMLLQFKFEKVVDLLEMMEEDCPKPGPGHGHKHGHIRDNDN